MQVNNMSWYNCMHGVIFSYAIKPLILGNHNYRYNVIYFSVVDLKDRMKERRNTERAKHMEIFYDHLYRTTPTFIGYELTS